jgi:hypothetical protein
VANSPPGLFAINGDYSTWIIQHAGYGSAVTEGVYKLQGGQNAIRTVSHDCSAVDDPLGWWFFNVSRGQWLDSLAAVVRRHFFRAAPFYGRQDGLVFGRAPAAPSSNASASALFLLA